MRAGRAVRFAGAALAMLAACGQQPQRPPAPPSGPVLGAGPYHFVSVLALDVSADAKTVNLRLSNNGQFAACVLASSLPGASVEPVHVYSANGAERRAHADPHYDPETLSRVEQIEPGAHFDASTTLHSRLHDGDCVLLDATYEPCRFVEDGHVDPTLGIPANTMGSARGLWRFSHGMLTPIAEGERSCLDQTGYVEPPQPGVIRN